MNRLQDGAKMQVWPRHRSTRSIENYSKFNVAHLVIMHTLSYNLVWTIQISHPVISMGKGRSGSFHMYPSLSLSLSSPFPVPLEFRRRCLRRRFKRPSISLISRTRLVVLKPKLIPLFDLYCDMVKKQQLYTYSVT